MDDIDPSRIHVYNGVIFISPAPEDCSHAWSPKHEHETEIDFRNRIAIYLCCHCKEIQNIIDRFPSNSTLSQLINYCAELVYQRIILSHKLNHNSEPISEDWIQDSIIWMFIQLIMTNQMPHFMIKIVEGKEQSLWLLPTKEEFFAILGSVVQKLDFNAYEFDVGAIVFLNSFEDLWPIYYEEMIVGFIESFPDWNFHNPKIDVRTEGTNWIQLD